MKHREWDGWAGAGAAAVGALLIAVAAIPTTVALPTRDGGVFLYAGRRLLAGESLYRGVWDHKPPGIHLINAAGLFVADGSAWGVWGLALLAVGCASVIMWQVLRRAYGYMPAAAGLLMWLAGLALLPSALNTPEVFSLPIIAITLWLSPILADPRRSRVSWLALGALIGGALLLKPNLVGTCLATMGVTAFLRLRSGDKRALTRPLLTAMVVAISTGLVVLISALVGVLPDLIDAVITYNRSYTSVTGTERAMIVLMGVMYLAKTLVTPCALGGWIVFLRGGWRRVAPEGAAIVWSAGLALPIEIALAAFTGRGFAQNFFAWLPACVVLGAFPLYDLSNWLRRGSSRGHTSRRRLVGALGIFPFSIAFALVLGTTVAEATAVSYLTAEDRPSLAAVEVLRATTKPADPVLVWGAQTEVYFLAGRIASSRFTYHHPLLTDGYASPRTACIFYADLVSRPPAAIIDTAATNPGIVPIAPGQRARWPGGERIFSAAPQLEAPLDLIAAQYVAAGTIGQGAWIIYLPRTSDREQLQAAFRGADLCRRSETPR